MGQKRIFLLVMVALSLALVPDPALRQERIFVFVEPLIIKTTKTFPPRLAFVQTQNLLEDPTQIRTAKISLPAINLSEIVANQILRPALQSIRYKRVDLPLLSIAKNEPRQPSVLATESSTFNSEDYSNLSERDRRWLYEARVTPRDFDMSGAASALQRNLAEKVQEQIRNVKSQVPSGWVISGEKSANPIAEAAKPLPRGSSLGQASSGSAEAGSGQPERKASYRKENKSSYKIEGHLGIDHRSPFLPGSHFEVHWMREGVARKAGEVNPTKARFSIEIPELVGELEVNLYDVYGTRVAVGALRLSPELQESNLLNLSIRLQPARSVSANFTDFYRSSSNSKSKSKLNVKTRVAFDFNSPFSADRDGNLYVDGVSTKSTTMAVSEAEGYYPTVSILETVNTSSVTMFPKKTIKALIEIIEEQERLSPADRNGALIVGRVFSASKAQEGVRVELADNINAKPIYLNEIFIPDPNLSATSSNGYFVFVNLSKGHYSINAYLGNQFFGFGNAVSEPNSVFVASVIGHSTKSPLEVRAFDAFTGEGLKGELRLQSMGEGQFNIDGYAVLDHPETPQNPLAWFDVDDDQYIDAIYHAGIGASHIHLPSIRRSWIESIKVKAGVVTLPDYGAVLGFVANSSYEINLPHLVEAQAARIVFFDSAGQVSENPVSEGGFIIFNVPDSAQTVVLKQANGEVQSQVIPVESNLLTILRPFL